jgi:hypothetical protein
MTSVACPFAVVGVSFDPSLGFQLSYQNLPKSIISVAFHKYGKTVIDRSGENASAVKDTKPMVSFYFVLSFPHREKSD